MTGLSNTFVCLMGMGTVFIGLICIVLICNIQSMILTKVSKPKAQAKNIPTPTESDLNSSEKAEIIAGACACIAEELGTDASNIKVLSFKKV